MRNLQSWARPNKSEISSLPNLSPSWMFFVHRGPLPPYLQAAIMQALTSNRESEAVLFCDDHVLPTILRRRSRLKVLAINDFSRRAEAFAKLYSHHGKNPYSYTLGNLQRWFIISEFLESRKEDFPFVYLDSDAFLFADIRHVLGSFSTQMSVCFEVGPQFTFFKNKAALREYVDFIEYSFSNEKGLEGLQDFVDRRSDHGVPHIGDMVTMGRWAEIKELEDLGKVDLKRDLHIFDENIGTSQGLKLGILGKKLITKSGTKYFLDLTGMPVLAGGVHLQGGNKLLWPRFVSHTVHIAFLRAEPISYLAALVAMIQKALLVILSKAMGNLRISAGRISQATGKTL